MHAGAARLRAIGPWTNRSTAPAACVLRPVSCVLRRWRALERSKDERPPPLFPILVPHPLPAHPPSCCATLLVCIIGWEDMLLGAPRRVCANRRGQRSAGEAGVGLPVQSCRLASRCHSQLVDACWLGSARCIFLVAHLKSLARLSVRTIKANPAGSPSTCACTCFRADGGEKRMPFRV